MKKILLLVIIYQVACIKTFTTRFLNTTIYLNNLTVNISNLTNIVATIKDQYNNLVNYGNLTFII